MLRDPLRAAMAAAPASGGSDDAGSRPRDAAAPTVPAREWRRIAQKAPPSDPSARRSAAGARAAQPEAPRAARLRADGGAGAPAEAPWLPPPHSAFAAAAAAPRAAQRGGGGSCEPPAAAAPAAMDGLRSLLERLSRESGVTLRVRDLSFVRFKPATWHAVLRAALARCERRRATWRTPAEALAALNAECEAHVKAEEAQEAPTHPARAPALHPARRCSPSPPPRRSRSRSRENKRGSHPKQTPVRGISHEELTAASLHVRYLPLDATAAEVAAFFGRFGALRFVVSPTPGRQRSGDAPQWRCASVTFMERSNAAAAMLRAAHSPLRPLGGPMRIMIELSDSAMTPRGHFSAEEWVAPEQRAGCAGGGDGARSRPRSRSRSRSRSRDRGGHGDRRRREASPPRWDRDRDQRAKSASQPHAASHAMPMPQPPLPEQPSMPPAQSLPLAVSRSNAMLATSSMVMPQVQYRSFITCALFGAAAAPIAVVGSPLSGDPALPRPLALELHWPASGVEALGAHLPASRRSVVAMDGEDAAAAAALHALAAQLAAPMAQPGGEAWAAGVFSSDGAAHFFLPPSQAALRLILAARPDAPPPSLTAAGIAVSFLLTDAAAAAAENTRAAIVAALQGNSCASA